MACVFKKMISRASQRRVGPKTFFGVAFLLLPPDPPALDVIHWKLLGLSNLFSCDLVLVSGWCSFLVLELFLYFFFLLSPRNGCENLWKKLTGRMM
jgi:hypothetical protein